MDLKGKSVVVGVCGGIAAYKVVEVVSRLKKMGAEVDVIMTANARKFVTPLTFRSLSHRPVVTDMFSDPEYWEIKHVSLAQKADLFIIAPATANIIGKLASGIADDMLTTTVVATKAPVLVVPAMNHDMYANAIVQRNIRTLRELGYIFMEPDTGRMAEGSSGKGRLPEPSAIVEKACSILKSEQDLAGIRIMVTAGPTRESIDPVRYITNHSSGKMGYAVAQAARERGADVLLISGPAEVECPDGVRLISVTTAQEMEEAVLANFENSDVVVMAAAVADYRPAEVSETKIKKNGDEMVLRLVKNPDILKKLGTMKGNRILVGFSAETDDLEGNAADKLESKNLDMIVANDVTMEGAGFGTDTNIIKILKCDGTVIDLPLMSKLEAAHRILDEVRGLAYAAGDAGL
ncbi:MAG: bifunctional phosphopantothenoylcysteine decarboxylase/phosphopantothenate--cysteine ligase CoaBC [Clostridiaceae bacterium]|nr:bifunctional phosphopantothenoylcysteine decarboxylase/phosphopantothenate--cysteine ligase CoaBC [Clostridiaceae bacterium]